MPEHFDTNDYAAEAVVEYVTEGLAHIAEEGDLPAADDLKMAALAVKAGLTLIEIHNIEHDPHIPSEYQNWISALAVAKLFDAAAVGIDLQATADAAFTRIDDVPANLTLGDGTTMTKDQFYDYLAAHYPDEFVLDSSGHLALDGTGHLVEPSYITSPQSSPDFSGVDAATAHSPLPSASPASAWTGQTQTSFGGGEVTGSPLVLDLGTSGIALTSKGSSGAVYFGMEENGFQQATGWISGNTAFLAVDKNGDGIINDRGELFGNDATHATGFRSLAAYDSNYDGHITAADAQFSKLIVWTDDNHDGYSQVSELHSLSSLGITDINLGYSTASTTLNGNDIKAVSTFTMNGVSHAIADVWFGYDTVNTVYDGSYTLDPQTMLLPDLRGYGQLPELDIAMSLDNSGTGNLESLVQALASKTPAEMLASGADLERELENIIYRWAGVDGVDPNSRGGYFDAQKLEFLEHLLGTPYYNTTTLSSNPGSGAESLLTEAWTVAFGELSAKLLAQSGFSDLAGDPVYNPTTDTLSGGSAAWSDSTILQFLTPGANTTRLSAYNYIYVLAPGCGSQQIAENTTGKDTIMLSGFETADVRMWTDNTGRLHIQSNHNSADQILITLATTGAGGTTAEINITDHIQTILFGDGSAWDLSTTGLTLTGTSAGEGLYGSAHDDTINGAGGADTLYGNGGNDTLIAGANTTATQGSLVGGTGNDTYVFSAGYGKQYVQESLNQGTDTIHLQGFTPDEVRLWTDNTGRLHITDASNGANDIVVAGAVSGATGTMSETIIDQYVEKIAFDDTAHTTLNLANGLTLTGTSAGESLYGSAHNDTINGGGGADTIYGNGGNDTLIAGANTGSQGTFAGGAGDDTYIFSAGYGKQLVQESLSQGTDTIHMQGFTPDEVRLWTESNGRLHITDASNAANDIVVAGAVSGATGTLDETIVDQYVEKITFDDAAHTTWNLANGLTLTGTSAGESLYGSAHDDTIYGGSGTDYLYGNRGNDTYVCSAGYGKQYVQESLNQGTDTIHMQGFTPDEVRLWTDNTGRLHITDASNAANDVIVAGGVSSATGTTAETTVDQYVEKIAFDDPAHTTLNLANGLTLTGTTAGEGLYGSAHNDTIYGAGGADYLYGNGGNDTLVAGSGSAYLNGGAGADTFVLQGTGSKTVADFSTTQGDHLDIHSLLTGYNPVTSAITDFVHITASGSNAIVSVDADGAANGHNYVQVATLTGMSSLAGHEADLLASGNLIAHV